jgi:hypothetical protein
MPQARWPGEAIDKLGVSETQNRWPDVRRAGGAEKKQRVVGGLAWRARALALHSAWRGKRCGLSGWANGTITVLAVCGSDALGVAGCARRPGPATQSSHAACTRGLVGPGRPLAEQMAVNRRGRTDNAWHGGDGKR